MDQGVHGRLTSTTPPITVPAWTAMMTSQDPGQLGVYGFRNRADHTYGNLVFADSRYVKARTVWSYLSRARKRSLVIGVPQTYPPKPLAGAMVACFLTPDRNATFTFPPDLKVALDEAAGGEYIIDVKDFRTSHKERLYAQIRTMTTRRFQAFRNLYRASSYDFAIMVEMGPDRIHHGFWRYFDTQHRLYERGNPYENVVLDYYKQLDEEIGRTIETLPPDTSVMVVSDHGAKAMDGAIAINEWLLREGYLVLKEKPNGPVDLSPELVDWKRTRVWGEGGYYARVFLNVAGREPEGVIPPEEYASFRSRLAAQLSAIPDEKGRPIGTMVHTPEEVYKEVNGVPPDLMVYFGDLSWRSAGKVGLGSIHLRENDTGPDDANHAWEGIFIWDRKDAVSRQVYSIYDIAPSILSFFDVRPSPEMRGKSLLTPS